VLGLVDPAMTGMGGDAFALFYSAGPRTISGLNGSGRSASGATLANVLADLKLDGAGVGAETLQYATIPTESALSVTVPGAAAAWVDVVERFGSGRVGMGPVLAPAIELAEGGCGVGEVAAYWWAAREGELRAKANGAEVLWADPEAEGGCRAPRVGEVYRNEMLARTMRLLVEKGKKGFYEGPVAEAVVEVVKAEGGYLSLEDLKHHGEVGSEMTEALPFRLEGELYAYMAGNDGAGLDLWQHLPNGQGKVTQMALGLLQELQKNGTLPRFKPEDHNSTK
jgi:gamma-glutamyltranspeptidase/glutathione hydrolase